MKKGMFAVVVALVAAMMSGCGGGTTAPVVAPAGTIQADLEGWQSTDGLVWAWSNNYANISDDNRIHMKLNLDLNAKSIVARLLFNESSGMVYATVSAENAPMITTNKVKFSTLGWQPLWADCPVELTLVEGRGNYIHEVDGGLELNLGDNNGQYQIEFRPSVAWTPVD